MLRPTPSRSSSCPRLEERDHLLEQAADAVGFGIVAPNRDLVPAHVNGHGERVLDEPQQLVALAEQPDHQMVAGNEDLTWVGDGVGTSPASVVPNSGSPVAPRRSLLIRAGGAQTEGVEPAAELLGLRPSTAASTRRSSRRIVSSRR
jgi:hypothetical protein